MAEFPRRVRLLTPADYRAVFSKGKRISLPGFTVIVAPNTLGHPRVGLAIARKVLRKATARNRVKRCVRESFRHHQDRLAAVDLVVLSRPDLSTLTGDAMRASLGRLWSRLDAGG